MVTHDHSNDGEQGCGHTHSHLCVMVSMTTMTVSIIFAKAFRMNDACIMNASIIPSIFTLMIGVMMRDDDSVHIHVHI